MNPGLAQILTIVHSTDVADIECHLHRVGRCVLPPLRRDMANFGFGWPVDDPEVPRLLEVGTRVFDDGVRLMADCLHIELDPNQTE